MNSPRIQLEVLSETRIPELFAHIGTDPEVYRWLNFTPPKNFHDFEKVFRNYIAEAADGKRIAHAVILKESNKAIGTTSYMDINHAHSALEIGSTFYAKEYWRSFVNTECKFLMLSNAFEKFNCERITLKTDSNNERSRAAILRIGATFEGILRHHMKRPDGTWRDSAYFSILRSEWPGVKTNLLSKIGSPAL